VFDYKDAVLLTALAGGSVEETRGDVAWWELTNALTRDSNSTPLTQFKSQRAVLNGSFRNAWTLLVSLMFNSSHLYDIWLVSYQRGSYWIE